MTLSAGKQTMRVVRNRLLYSCNTSNRFNLPLNRSKAKQNVQFL